MAVHFGPWVRAVEDRDSVLQPEGHSGSGSLTHSRSQGTQKRQGITPAESSGHGLRKDLLQRSSVPCREGIMISQYAIIHKYPKYFPTLASPEGLESPEVDVVRDVGLALPAWAGREEIGIGSAEPVLRDQ